PAEGIANANYGFLLSPVRADNGVLAFVGWAAGTAIDDSNNAAVWLGQPAALATLAREGAQAPGTPAGVKFNDFRLFQVAPRINANGKIALKAYLTGTGVT